MRSPAWPSFVFSILFSALGLTACAGTEAPPEASVAESTAALGEPVKRVQRLHTTIQNHAPTDCTQHYYGGPVIGNAEIVAVYWTGLVDATITGNVPQFWTDVMQSSYLDWMASEYNTLGLNGFTDNQPGSNQGIGHGTYLGAYTIAPSVCATPPCTLTGSQIDAELVKQLQQGHLPTPTVGCDGQPKTVYMIEFPEGVSINDGTGVSCTDYCAYHSTARYAGKPVPYGVFPFMGAGSACANGCGTGGYIGRTTSTHAHELAEAITDPDTGSALGVGRPMGWYNDVTNCGELGDPCFNDGTTTVNGRTWVVQTLWSNTTHGCTASAPVVPLCTAANTPAGCRPCACQDVGGLCSGATPSCETDATNIKSGFCVQCATNAQCGVNSCTKSTNVSTDDTCLGGCAPITACPAGSCGAVPDACGGTLNCGGCAATLACLSNRCVIAPSDGGTGGGAGGSGGSGGSTGGAGGSAGGVGGAGGGGADLGGTLVYTGDSLGPTPPGGCSCQAGGLAGPLLGILALGLKRRRRAS